MESATGIRSAVGWRKVGDVVELMEAALGVIGAEYEELVRAVERETPERVRDEALDVAVTALRLWAGEEICL